MAQKKKNKVGKYYDMKKTFIWLVASLLFTMVGCVEGLQETGVNKTSSEQLPDLTAGFAEEKTKTYVESGKFLRWHEDDRLTVFWGNARNRQYKFNGATGDNNGSFSHVSSGDLETGNPLDRIYAVYPYSETTKISDEGQISLTLPAVQSYAENSFGRGANTMLAVTENTEDNFLAFKNACGYLKLKLYNAEGSTIKSIVVKGNDQEKIAGAATATITFGETPQLTMSDDATTTITLDCGKGVALGTTAEEATEFWVVIPETTFEGGITITVTDTKRGVFEKSTTKEVVIERNIPLPMEALGAEFTPAIPANNEIWYTATAKITPNDKTVFGATYLSNEWDSETGMGVITFDNAVTSIGERAFQSYTPLTSITIPNSVTTIGQYAFTGCKNLTSVTIPNSVTAIGNNAFRTCRSLTSINIPNSVTTIEERAFLNCSSLTSITIPDSVTLIGNNAFSGCSGLTSVNIGKGVTTIGEHAFYECSSLTGVTIPDSVTEIGGYAFNKCSGLTSVNIGKGVTTIGENVFSECSDLTSVTIPNSVTTIGASAFRSCTSLTSITIPNSVTTIGDGAFSGCENLQEFKGNFTSDDGRCLIIDGTLKSFFPAGLTEYTIPNSVTTIGNSAFSGCSNLTSITIPNSVTAIGNSAFSGCSNLTSITIPNSVTAIGNNAFGDCSSLTSITIPNSVTEMGDYAFSGCSSLTNITIPNSVTTIGARAFFNCSSLTSVTIPNNVTTIGDGAFCGCSSLTSITIPNSVTTIGASAFFNCSSLTSITIPNNVTTIGDGAFYNCSSLTSVTIPNSVTTIGASAFYNCSSLTSITIPDSVEYITPLAFSQCEQLKNVYCKATTPPEMYYREFSSDCKIYVPVESVDAYKYSEYRWSEYADAIIGYDFENNVVVE